MKKLHCKHCGSPGFEANIIKVSEYFVTDKGFLGNPIDIKDVSQEVKKYPEFLRCVICGKLNEIKINYL